MGDKRWCVWIASSNTYTQSDSNSEIDPANLPVELQVICAPDWTPIYVEFMDPGIEKANENSRGGFETFQIGLEPMIFDADMDDYMNVLLALTKRYKYIAMDGGVFNEGDPAFVPQEAGTKYPYRWVTENMVLALDNLQIEPSSEHNHNEGSKVITIQCRKKKPTFS